MNVEDDASLRKSYAALKKKTDVKHEKRAQGILSFFFYVKSQLKSCLAHAFLGWSDLEMHAKLVCPHFYRTDSRKSDLPLSDVSFLPPFIHNRHTE